MSGAGTDLIAGYLAELRAGLWVPAAEAELIVAEAEDHLRETAAVGLEVGMTELEAHQAAISNFGPVRAVIRAHRRRTVTAGDVVMVAWKLTGLLGATVGASGLAAVFLLHSLPVWAWRPPVPLSGPVCQCSVRFTITFNWAVMAMPYAATAAGGLALLATRQLATRRLARRATSGRYPLSPAVTAIFFLLVSALLLALNVSGVGALTLQGANWTTPISSGSTTTIVPLVPGAIIAGCLAVALGYGLQTAVRLARCRPGSGAPALPGRDPLSPAATASFFLLVSAVLFALNVTGVGSVTNQVAWLNLPLSSGSTTTAAPLVPSAIIAGCLAVAVGCGVQAALRLARRGPGSAAPAMARSGSG